jgi:hypothetical protein
MCQDFSLVDVVIRAVTISAENFDGQEFTSVGASVIVSELKDSVNGSRLN